MVNRILGFVCCLSLCLWPQDPKYHRMKARQSANSLLYSLIKKVKKLILKFILRIGKLLPVYRQSFFCSAVLTQQHYHWYAATRFAFPGG